LIVINYFAAHQTVAELQFIAPGEALARETCGVDIDRCAYPTQRFCGLARRHKRKFYKWRAKNSIGS
jgi:hypothetical protein